VLVEHRGSRPVVDPSVYVAPTAVLCGDVRVGPDARILFGAVISAEDGHVEIGPRCVVMENALVRGRAAHVNTVLPDEGVVPIGWVAVGDPASALPPRAHDEIWAVQEGLDFPGAVYRLARGTPARERMERQTAWLAAHRSDRVLGEGA
jgi:carbonic anhydrase/acetyltransferase-like protein (isoleucine patch superfamily)